MLTKRANQGSAFFCLVAGTTCYGFATNCEVPSIRAAFIASCTLLLALTLAFLINSIVVFRKEVKLATTEQSGANSWAGYVLDTKVHKVEDFSFEDKTSGLNVSFSWPESNAVPVAHITGKFPSTRAVCNESTNAAFNSNYFDIDVANRTVKLKLEKNGSEAESNFMATSALLITINPQAADRIQILSPSSVMGNDVTIQQGVTQYVSDIQFKGLTKYPPYNVELKSVFTQVKSYFVGN